MKKSNKELTEDLKELLSHVRPSWEKETYDKINEIKRAIKSKYPETKKNILKKYS